MNRKVIGIILLLIGVIAMCLNVLFFKSNGNYDLIRGLSFASFLVGTFMIPTYQKPKKG